MLTFLILKLIILPVWEMAITLLCLKLNGRVGSCSRKKILPELWRWTTLKISSRDLPWGTALPSSASAWLSWAWWSWLMPKMWGWMNSSAMPPRWSSWFQTGLGRTRLESSCCPGWTTTQEASGLSASMEESTLEVPDRVGPGLMRLAAGSGPGNKEALKSRVEA